MIAISILILPSVISSMTPLVTYGSSVASLSVKYAPELTPLKAIDPTTLAALTANPADTAAATAAVGEIARTFSVPAAVAVRRLTALSTVPPSDLAFLNAHGTAVVSAAAAVPGQWRNWWWVCVGGEALFLPFIFMMTGRWSPRRAREDAEAHEREVAAELAAWQA